MKQKSRKQAHCTFEPNDTCLIKAELNFSAEKLENSLEGKKLFSFDHILPTDFRNWNPMQYLPKNPKQMTEDEKLHQSRHGEKT